MIKKQWSKNPNKEFIVGPCKWCNKELVNTDSYIAFNDKERACNKCYRNSGHMLPFFTEDKHRSKQFK